MKINISVTVDTPEEAKTIIDRMTRNYDTWVDLQAKGEALNVKRADLINPGTDEGVSAMAMKPRKNVTPGEPSIGKMGKATEAEITKLLNAGKEVPAKYAEHLKLMWKREMVKYDGETYYVD